jgi:hypothetical protein
MKGNLAAGNGTNDLQKSGISNQQDLGNPMFSSNIFRQQQFFESKLLFYSLYKNNFCYYVVFYILANKPLMNSNQQTHQAMQGKYSSYQVSASQNNQLVNFFDVCNFNNNT